MGHAIADAMGVPNEFKSRDFLLKNPTTTMTGYGTYNVEAGSFSDDTSMILATIDSFIYKKCFDYNDIMKNFSLYLHEARFTPANEMFDVGITCANAIYNYEKGIEPLKCGLDGYYDNGNGSLMRILPVIYYCFYKNSSDDEIYELVKNLSSLTHRHEISILGCFIYTLYILCLLKGLDKYESYKYIQNYNYHKYFKDIASYNRILNHTIYKYSLNEIKSSGYIVDTLEAVLYVVLTTSSYKEAVIKAINLGGDTDTVGAIGGAIAGIMYGYENIPVEWLNVLIRKDYILDLCSKYEMLLK